MHITRIHMGGQQVAESRTATAPQKGDTIHTSNGTFKLLEVRGVSDQYDRDHKWHAEAIASSEKVQTVSRADAHLSNRATLYRHTTNPLYGRRRARFDATGINHR